MLLRKMRKELEEKTALANRAIAEANIVIRLYNAKPPKVVPSKIYTLDDHSYLRWVNEIQRHPGWATTVYYFREFLIGQIISQTAENKARTIGALEGFDEFLSQMKARADSYTEAIQPEQPSEPTGGLS